LPYDIDYNIDDYIDHDYNYCCANSGSYKNMVSGR
jgi:hypothetical protein